MKKSELKQVIKEEIQKLTETGEMSKDDLKKGGEYYEWGQYLLKAAKKLKSLTGNKVQILNIYPFDKYQGPYVNLKINDINSDLWSTEEEDIFYIEYGNNAHFTGTIQHIAKQIKNEVK